MQVNQELGRIGVLPFSKFWASNKPFNAPAAGLALQWLVSVIVILAPPPGDAFNFVLNCSSFTIIFYTLVLMRIDKNAVVSYPLAIINAFISAGLLFLYTPYSKRAGFNWAPPFRASWPVVLFFFLSNVFLSIAPLVPPAPGMSPYISLPYWLHVVVSLGVFVVGGIYWVVWARVLPRLGKYRLERHLEIQDDGVSRSVFTKVKED